MLSGRFIYRQPQPRGTLLINVTEMEQYYAFAIVCSHTTVYGLRPQLCNFFDRDRATLNKDELNKGESTHAITIHSTENSFILYPFRCGKGFVFKKFDSKAGDKVADWTKDDWTAGVELKPCPFCGAPAFFWRTNHEYFIECHKFDVRFHQIRVLGETAKEAIEAWNTRV